MYTLYKSSPQLYMSSFVEIGAPVPEQKLFEGFLPIFCAYSHNFDHRRLYLLFYISENGSNHGL